MIYDRDQLVKDMRADIVEITYNIPETGLVSFRLSLLPSLLPEQYAAGEIDEEIKWHEENKDMITGWNIRKGGWVTLEAKNIISAQSLASV